MKQNGVILAAFAPSESASGGNNMANPPIDAEHLSRQTMGDSELQREVLLIFIEQVAVARREVPAARGEERKRLAHKLKGAARAVGAFALADCAELLMNHPEDTKALQQLDSLADEAGSHATALAG